MADVNKTILFELDLKTGKITDETGRVVKSFGELAQQYDKATAAGRRYNKEQKNINKLQEDQARSAGLAGAAAFELGRTISDLPFGIVAVTNNISQLGTIFAALVSNAGSVKKAFDLLIGQLIGPAGILIAFQALTAALTVFGQKSAKAEKAAKDFTESLLEQRLELLLLRKELNKENLTEEERAEIFERQKLAVKDLGEAVRLGLISRERELEILQELDGISDKRREIAREDVKNAEENEKILKRITQLEDQRAKKIAAQEEERRRRLPTLTAAQAAEMELGFKQEIDYINSKIAQQEERALMINARKNELNAEISKTVASLNNEVSKLVDSEEKRSDIIAGTIEYYNEQINKLEETRDSTATTTAEVKKFNDEIAFLQFQLEALAEGEPLKVENIIETKGISENLSAVLVTNLRGKKVWKVVKKTVTEQLAESLDPEQMTKDLQATTNFNENQLDLDRLFKLSEQAKEIGKKADLVKNIASSLNDILSAQADREIAIEKNKTTKLNDQLKARLANEQLSADERDKINQQISRNEAALVERQNKIARKQFQREKALKIIMALADTASSASKAYLSQFLPIPTPDSPARGTVAAGLATAFGLAQVAALSRMKYTEQGMPTPNLVAQGAGGGAGGVQSPSFNVVGSSSQNQLAAAIAGAESKPVKAYVVSSDVSTAQEFDRKIVEGASI